MSWPLVARLSLLGLLMGIATVFVIPSNVEPLCWLVIFAVSAYLIAKRVAGKYFLHGLLVGIANSVWVTAAHVVLFDHYIANHPREAAMMTSMPLPGSPRLMMALVGPVIGIASGLLIGVLAMLVANLVSRGATPSQP